MRSFPAPFLVCLPLERVVAVSSAARQPKHQGATQVRRPHQWPPSLELPNVDHFVVAGNIQGGIGLPKDRVAQGERHRTFHEPEPLQKPLHATAVELDDAATQTGAAPRAKADDANYQAKQRVRRGPEEGEKAQRDGDEGIPFFLGHDAESLWLFIRLSDVDCEII